MTTYLSGLKWLLTTLLLPILLFGALLLGNLEADKISLFSLFTGIFAYIWLIIALMISCRSGSNRGRGWQSQLALVLASFPFSLNHAQLSPATDWVRLTGNIALFTLLALIIYTVLYYLTDQLPSLPLRLQVVLTHLNAVAVALIFIHVQLIESIRQNLVFMTVFYLVTLPVLWSYLKAIARAHPAVTKGKPETSQQLKEPKNAIIEQ